MSTKIKAVEHSVAEQITLAAFTKPRLGGEKVELSDSLGRILAEDIKSDIDMPPTDRSTMDGFAFRKEDIDNELKVIATLAAGHPPKCTIESGQCARIMTGAATPEGTDCIVKKEDIEELSPDKIRIIDKEKTGHIRSQGKDAKIGDALLKAGTQIAPWHISVLAACGCAKPLVATKPRVGIISTGDELVPMTHKPYGHQLRDTNGHQLAAMARSVGCDVNNYGTVSDDKQSTIDAFQKAIGENDVVVSAGGVSVGDFDFVRPVLNELDLDVKFERLDLHPGRPAVFAVGNDVFCFGLAGNPVSNFVSFEILVKPFLYRLMGASWQPKMISIPIAEKFKRKKIDRHAYRPVRLNKKGQVVPIDYHGSAHIQSFTDAIGLMCVEKGVKLVKAGEIITVRLFG